MAGIGTTTTKIIKNVMPKTVGDGVKFVGAGAGIALTVGTTVGDYKEARQQGNSKLISAGKAIGTFAVMDMLGWAMIPISLASTGVQMAMASGKHTADMIQKQGYAQRGKFGSGYFDMNEVGYTMRQRSINAIQNNGLNLNSALGNEARTYYRSST